MEELFSWAVLQFMGDITHSSGLKNTDFRLHFSLKKLMSDCGALFSNLSEEQLHFVFFFV